ncbi:MAG: di-trans,poly-cis-decaprenylcistransferase [Chloroflexi bacterium RBG_16_50_9]|nr:MAG: di-trans,poly-cis-decaprenylcistransferase [Chloroflexi bacterium RBG_16_50_9]
METNNGLPRHIAIIMDGNGRWAERHGLHRMEGHRAGVENIRPTIKNLDKYSIKFVILYAFSTENWGRPEGEVRGLMNLLEEVIESESLELHKNGVRIRHIGRMEELTDKLRQSINKAVELTQHNTRMTLGVAFNYGGRAEILDAACRIIADGLAPGDISEKLFGSYLYTAGFPDVDLVIRTGGEIRTSNFLIWQSAYSEYYFTPVLWPDFNEEELTKALLGYGQRQRRFGVLPAKTECSEKDS